MKLENKYSYYLVAVMSVFFMSGMMGTRPLIPLLLSEQIKATPSQIGLVIALYPMIPLLLAVKMGKWVDRIGAKTPLMISAFIGSFALFFPYFSLSLISIAFSQLIAGISQTVFVVSAQSFMGNTNDEKSSESNIAIFTIGVSIGSFLGPLFGGTLADAIGYPYSFFLLGWIGALSTLFALFIKESKKERNEKDTAQTKGRIYDFLRIKNIRRAFLISSIILLAKDIFVSYFPLLAAEFGLSNTVIGMLISLNAGAGIFIRLIMPKIIQMFGRSRVVFLSIFTSGILFLMIPFFHHQLMLAILSFALGLGLGIGQPLSISITISTLPKHRVGEGLGLRLSFNRLTQVTGPILFGILADGIGFVGIFLLAGAMIVLGSTKTNIN